jgi:methylenetetrahydrofolate reductase (NADPH)
MWEPVERRYFCDRVEPLLGRDAVYVGEVGGRDKLDLLSGAAALLNPIRWPEPFGLVMIEALACGTPVLAFAEGAAPEIIEHGHTGFLCADEGDMTARIGVAADLDRGACRASVEAKFSTERMVEDHLALYRSLADEPGPDGEEHAPGLFLGTAVSPFKRLESEVILQYLKLGMKARAGADFVIPQLGYDARKWDELLRWMRLHRIRLPILANVYVLTRTVARLFHANEIPGCVVSDELLAVIEKAAAGPDKGKSFFLELAAKQVAIARGMGFRGAYLAGHTLPAGDVEKILAMADAFAPDWPALAKGLQFSPRGTFFAYRRDPATGLNTDELDARYARSLTPAARARARRRGSRAYKVNRLTHDLAFAPGTAGYRAATRFYAKAEQLHLMRPLHAAEHAVKIPLFDCRDCGDCSLPDVAYLCPVSQCPKNERNGPCGGSHDGTCEVLPRPCVWVRAYDRAKPYGEELAMLDREPVLVDHALARTSAWANTYLGRDHYGRAAARAAAAGLAAADAAAPPSSAPSSAEPPKETRP